MADDTISSYMKIEMLKHSLLTYLKSIGLEEQVRVMNDKDVNRLIALMSIMNCKLQELENDAERIELLVNNAIYLWALLIVDYGLDLVEV